jgi:hypothetical protein
VHTIQASKINSIQLHEGMNISYSDNYHHHKVLHTIVRSNQKHLSFKQSKPHIGSTTRNKLHFQDEILIVVWQTLLWKHLTTQFLSSSVPIFPVPYLGPQETFLLLFFFSIIQGLLNGGEESRIIQAKCSIFFSTFCCVLT